METDKLIAILANSASSVDAHEVRNRLSAGTVVALGCSLLLVMAMIGVRADIGIVVTTTTFWAKTASAVFIAAGGLWMSSRLVRPGTPLNYAWTGVATPLVVMTVAAFLSLAQAPAGTTWSLASDYLWRACPFQIVLLSIPGLGALLYSMRKLAPTQLRLTGAVAGLVAGAAAALVYCLHCPEMNAAFWIARYALGIACSTLIGALMGARYLRW